MIPFFNFPHQRNILDQVLDQQGTDKFEKPYAEWRIRWKQGDELFRGVKRTQRRRINHKDQKLKYYLEDT